MPMAYLGIWGHEETDDRASMQLSLLAAWILLMCDKHFWGVVCFLRVGSDCSVSPETEGQRKKRCLLRCVLLFECQLRLQSEPRGTWGAQEAMRFGACSDFFFFSFGCGLRLRGQMGSARRRQFCWTSTTPSGSRPDTSSWRR